MAARLDELDRRLIAALQEDGRTSNREIARHLDVSEGTIRARLRRLDRDDVIRIQAVSDVRAADLSVVAYVGFEVEPGHNQGVMEALLQWDEIMFAATAIGRFSIITLASFADREALLTFLLEDVSAIPGVIATNTSELVTIVKHDYRWVRIHD